jgi:lipopolysaccharide export system permease protein
MIKKTSFFYIFNEIIHIFVIGLMTFTIILLMDKIFKLIDLIVGRGADPFQILKLFAFISPSFLVFTIPMSVLLGTLLTFGRLSGDNEITAFKASGISLYQLFIPVFIFSVMAYLLATILVFYGLPWGNRGFKETIYTLARSKADMEIKERVFNDSFNNLVVYVDKVPLEENKLEGILIYDDREQDKLNTIFAKEGYIINNPNSDEITLRLLDGDIHRFEPKKNVFQRVHFETYDLNLELTRVFQAIGRKFKDKEMSAEEISEKIRELEQKGEEATPYKLELHKRYAFPFASIVFALIAVPLGIQPSRSGRSSGFIFGIFIILFYYISLSFADIFALRHTIPPYVAAWIPNVLFGVFGIYILIKSANESPFKPLVWLNEIMNALMKKWKGLANHA